MKKILSYLLFVTLSLNAIEIDYKALENIVEENRDALKERVILAKYYEKNQNDLKAMLLIDEVLKADAKNVDALRIKKHLQAKEKAQTIFREAGLTRPVTQKEAQKRLSSYYTNSNYQFYSNLYQALDSTNVALQDSYHIKAAYIYLWDSRYKESEEALSYVQQNNNIDVAKIRADICYYTGKYRCSVRLYEKLYHSNYNIDTAIKLINSYLYLGETAKAERLYNYIYRKYPNNTKLQASGKSISEAKNRYLKTLKEAYIKEPSIKTLEPYANALYTTGKKDETVSLVHIYNEKNVSEKSLLLEAKYLIWMGKTEKALVILKNGSLNNVLAAKLMLGQVYSWDQKFDEAKKNLNEVIVKTKDKEQLYNAQKALAYVYMWEKNDAKAKELFTNLQQQKKDDKEISEALMELRHDYAGLIKIYKGRTGAYNAKRLGELYKLNKQPIEAIKQLKEYVDANPSDLSATKELAILLIENKEYYQGFGYLEYYAAQKQTSKAQILLAKNYYWSGFSKEALDVLDTLLKNESKNKEALKLKAKILKVSPRFTTSNSGATTSMYFDELGKKQLFLADTLYFNGHYKASLKYYNDYLLAHPNNHDARYRYAFALENAHEYGKAEGEFSLIFWTKDSDELRYHYAYNMMRNGKVKEAQKLLLALKEKTYKHLDSKLSPFLNSWKKSWESLNFKEYSQFYDTNFLQDEMWSFRKQARFTNVNYISVGVYHPVYKKLSSNEYEIKFYQEYSTNKHHDKGYKRLHIKCLPNKAECKITDESWQEGEYKEELLLTPYIDKALQESEKLPNQSLTLNSKKKSLVNIMIFT